MGVADLRKRVDIPEVTLFLRLCPLPVSSSEVPSLLREDLDLPTIVSRTVEME